MDYMAHVRESITSEGDEFGTAATWVCRCGATGTVKPEGRKSPRTRAANGHEIHVAAVARKAKTDEVTR